MSWLSSLIARVKAPSAGERGGILARLTPHGEAPRRGTRELLRALRTQPWPRAVVGLIANETAAVAWKLRRGPEPDAKEVVKHPFLELVKRPNPQMRGHEVVEFTQACLDLKGEAFWVVDRGQNGQPIGIYPVPPHWIAETATPDNPFFRGSYGSWQAAIPAQDVVWFRQLDIENPYGRGSGTGEALADELDTDEFAGKRAKNFFLHNASPEVMISAEGMGVDAARAAKEQWEANHRGYWNAFRSFWTGSKITVTRLDTSFKDMDLVALRAGIRDTVIQVYGVAPEKLGIIENSNRSTIDAADYLFAKGVLVPRLRRWAHVWAELLEQFPAAEGLVYAFVNPVPEDGEFKLRVMQAGPEAFSKNELRALVGMKEIDGGDKSFAPAFPSAGTVALEGEPEFVRQLPRRRLKAPAADGAISEADIPNVLEALRPERLIAELQPVFERRIEAWAKEQLAELGASGKFDLLNPLIPKYLAEWSTTRIKGLVDDTTRSTLRDTLAEGVRAGESIDDLLDRVEDVFTVADEVRAENIARTEVVGASNWATHEAQRVSGVVAKRKWVATRDGRTRAEHTALDGTEATLDEQFEVDGNRAPYPGAFGKPELDCNCRCTTVAVIDDDLGDEELAARPHTKGLGKVGSGAKTEELDAVWKAYDAELVPWESDAARALRRGFRSQKNEVRKALRAAAKGS
jgi:HK97 family phage portal protein